MGDSNEITRFEKKLELMVDHYHKSGILTDTVIERLLGQTGDNLVEAKDDAANSDIILFGNNGLVIKAKTENQRKMINAIVKNDMLFAIGPAGTGKTYTAVALAIKALKNKEVKRRRKFRFFTGRPERKTRPLYATALRCLNGYGARR
jgi:phosphate starvation-inducible PhoH-like protein